MEEFDDRRQSCLDESSLGLQVFPVGRVDSTARVEAQGPINIGTHLERLCTANERPTTTHDTGFWESSAVPFNATVDSMLTEHFQFPWATDHTSNDIVLQSFNESASDQHLSELMRDTRLGWLGLLC